jgi:hypothetical protein
MMGHDPLECVDLLRAELRKRELEASILLEAAKSTVAEGKPGAWQLNRLEKAIRHIEKAHV